MSRPVQVVPAALAEHLDALAQVAQLVARDLRSALAEGGDPMACVDRLAGAGTNGEPSVNHRDIDTLIDSHELADVLHINVRTLRRWRHEGRAPRPLKGKGPLRWRRAEVDRWMEERAS